MRPGFLDEGDGEPVQRAFDGAVNAAVLHLLPDDGAGNIDDVAGFPRDHIAHGFAAEQRGGPDRDGISFVQFRRGEVGDRSLAPVEAGIVDHDIRGGTEGRLGGGVEGDRRFGKREVKRFGKTTGLLAEGVQAPGIPAGGEDPQSPPAQLTDNFKANAA